MARVARYLDRIFLARREPERALEPKVRKGGIYMKGLHVIIAAFILVFGIVASPAANLDRISAATGVPVATLQTERSSTGLGWGSLEKAHLLANASGQSFDDIVALHQGGQGWGKIANDNGLKLGTLVSNAHRSDNAVMHANNTRTMHGRSGTHVAKDHVARTSTTRRVGHNSSVYRAHSMRSLGRTSGFRGMRSMGHMNASRGMGSMSHGGGHHR
jgi:hypothetical protein